MAAYRRVFDSRHLQADCQEPGSAPEPVIEYGLPVPFMRVCRLDQTLGKPGAWMVTTENEKQRLTVVVRLSRLESQVRTQGRAQRREFGGSSPFPIENHNFFGFRVTNCSLNSLQTPNFVSLSIKY